MLKMWEKVLNRISDVYEFAHNFFKKKDPVFELEKIAHIIDQFKKYEFENWGHVENYLYIFRSATHKLWNSPNASLVDAVVYMYATYMALGHEIAILTHINYWETAKMDELRSSLNRQVEDTLKLIPMSVLSVLGDEIIKMNSTVLFRKPYGYPTYSPLDYPVTPPSIEKAPE